MSIDEIPAGREMDALVAERVMGFRREVDDTFDYNGVRHGNEVLVPQGETLDSLRDMLPRKGEIPFGYFVTARYSADIAAAWLAVESLNERRIGVYRLWQVMRNVWVCELMVDGGNIVKAHASAAPLAICRAALKAVGVS